MCYRGALDSCSSMVVMSVQEVVFVWAMNSTSGGNTRLGLMWTCMRLHNRPQVCFPPNLQPEWLLTLVCIFVGCICITTTIHHAGLVSLGP
uniref:Uncharacterized protein n=1 Tax=Timema bartmani TaxID=61472 RepID=A0A7R9FDC1_9NEOP|nr:unnamed protein product [Timema bartmani]